MFFSRRREMYINNTLRKPVKLMRNAEAAAPSSSAPLHSSSVRRHLFFLSFTPFPFHSFLLICVPAAQINRCAATEALTWRVRRGRVCVAAAAASEVKVQLITLRLVDLRGKMSEPAPRNLSWLAGPSGGELRRAEPSRPAALVRECEFQIYK